MTEEEMNLVELSDEEGNVTSCEIYDIVEFEGKTYAMLLPVEEENEEEPELIVLEYVEDGEEEEYSIVGSQEADPFTNKISNESPIALAIMCKRVNEKVLVDSPNGKYEVKIKKISC